jgi:hypothetical protein
MQLHVPTAMLSDYCEQPCPSSGTPTPSKPAGLCVQLHVMHQVGEDTVQTLGTGDGCEGYGCSTCARMAKFAAEHTCEHTVHYS